MDLVQRSVTRGYDTTTSAWAPSFSLAQYFYNQLTGGRPPVLSCSSISISCTCALLSCWLTLWDELLWVWNVFPWQHCCSFPLAFRQWLSDARWCKLFAQKINQSLSDPLPKKSELQIIQKTTTVWLGGCAALTGPAEFCNTTNNLFLPCKMQG